MARKEAPTPIMWEPAERKKVISAAVDAMAATPGISLIRALCVGQLNALPANRRRPKTSLAIHVEHKFGREIEAEILRRQREKVRGQGQPQTTTPVPQAQTQPPRPSGFVQGIDKLTTDLAGMFETLLHRKMMEKATSVYQNVMTEFEHLINPPGAATPSLGMSADDVISKAPKGTAPAKTSDRAPSGKRKYTKRMDQVRGNVPTPPPPPAATPAPSGSPVGGEGFSAGQVGGVPAGTSGQDQSQQSPGG